MPRELGAHLPHAFRLQRPLQCLVWGGSLADLLPARDHSGVWRTAGRRKEGKDKLRFLLNLEGIIAVNSTSHRLFKQKLSLLLTLLF